MSVELQVERSDHWIVGRLTGAGTVHDIGRYSLRLVEECRRAGCKRLLLDLRGVTVPLSTTARYQLGQYAEVFASDSIRVAALATEGQLDRARFAEVVARNRGVDVRAFHDPQAAEDWLLAE